MRIGHVDLAREVLVAAEIGNNHEGRVALAEAMVREAAACGVQAVKFQTFRTEHYMSPEDPARFARLKSFELTPAQFASLADLAHGLGLLFISTPLDLGSVRILTPLVDAFKIASGDNAFYPLIRAVARCGKPVIVSSGLSDLDHIARTVAVVREEQAAAGGGDVAVLHCVTNYPVAPENANLAAIRTLADRLPLTIGYSDHTMGLEACVLAVALGARIIEKHFTLDKHFSDFRDHQLSADPADLRALVERIRDTEQLLGSGRKERLACEEAFLPVVRRSIVAAADLRKGHILAEADLMWTRPAGGLPPGEEGQLLARRLVRDIPAGQKLSASDVESLT